MEVDHIIIGQKGTEHKQLLGVIAVLSLVLIWSSNLVVTRYGVLNGFTAIDLVALRYTVAGLLLFPAFSRVGVKDLGGLGWKRGIALCCFAGAPYSVVFYYALGFVPASHGAVLNLGFTPLVVFIGMVFLGVRSFSL